MRFLSGWVACAPSSARSATWPCGALHRDLPSGAENAVPHVAAHPEWHAIHLLAILAVALWPIAFAGLTAVLTEGWSAILARIATGAVLVGLVIYVIDTALDGYVLKVAADTWAAASGTEKQEAFLIASAVYRVLQATFVASIIWLVGVPFSLMGLAVAVGRAFPAGSAGPPSWWGCSSRRPGSRTTWASTPSRTSPDSSARAVC